MMRTAMLISQGAGIAGSQISLHRPRGQRLTFPCADRREKHCDRFCEPAGLVVRAPAEDSTSALTVGYQKASLGEGLGAA
jgi:hypothetical protein